MRILAIDPGLANTGVVLFEGGKVKAVQTIRTDADGRLQFQPALERVKTIAVELSIVIERARPDEIVCELYRDIPGELRRVANRWSTPLVIGYLVAAVLEDWQHSGIPVVWQDPEVVMKAYSSHIKAWEAEGRKKAATRRRDIIVAGDQYLTNEHLRSAGAHGLYRIATSKGLQ